MCAHTHRNCQIVLTGCQTSDEIGNGGYIDMGLIDRQHNVTDFRTISNEGLEKKLNFCFCF